MYSRHTVSCSEMATYVHTYVFAMRTVTCSDMMITYCAVHCSFIHHNGLYWQMCAILPYAVPNIPSVYRQVTALWYHDHCRQVTALWYHDHCRQVAAWWYHDHCRQVAAWWYHDHCRQVAAWWYHDHCRQVTACTVTTVDRWLPGGIVRTYDLMKCNQVVSSPPLATKEVLRMCVFDIR